ncbi:MAG: hypothetical protein KBT68_02610 [bacterium]|nr:hypothetical protein [Candidatus Colisoma equi]
MTTAILLLRKQRSFKAVLLAGEIVLTAGAMGRLGAATLPAGYTELEYVEGTGTQYINTEYYPTPDTVATVDYQLTALSEPDHQTICGVNNGQGVATFKGYVRKTDNYFVLQIGDSDGWNSNNRVANLTRAKLVLDAQNKRAITTDAINGKGNLMSQSGITKTGTVPIGLFGRIDTWASIAGAFAKMKLYSAIFAEKGVAKRNFVPCLNESGVAGVYDTVQPKFYPSLKEDAFVAGPALATATVNDRSATASVTFPTAAVARELYLVGGQKDCAALATDWTYSVKVADIAANATTCTDVALPAAFAQGANKFYRLQIRSTAGKVEATTVSAVATWCDETGRRNVFADAAAVYVGAEDKNGNGLFDTGDWTDLRHAADPSSPTHQVSKYGSSPATNLVIRSVDVYSPTMDKTLKNQTCVFLKQGLEARTEDGKTIRRVYPASLNLNAPINGDTYTVLCRFRPGPKQTVRSTGDTWLFNLACYWNNSGVFFGFHGLGGADYADAYRIIYSNGDNTYSADQTLVVSNAFWHEVAFVVKGAYARVELANGAISGRQQNSLFKTFENANAFPSTQCISSAPWGGSLVQCIGNGTTAEVVTTDDIHMAKDFRGDIHMVAIWNRALTHDEIVEAFANPQPSLWRIGEKGCSADLLTGSTTGDVTTGTDMQEWRKVPRTLTKGRKLTLNFTVEPNQANLPQAVRLVPAKAVTASVRFTLDGADLGSAALVGTAPVFAFATKRQLGAGGHALVVERTDDGAGELAIDTLEMCGSWQIGNDDKLASSFGPYNATYADKEVISLAAQQHSGTTVVDYRSGSASWTPIKLHFFVPKEFVSDCKFAYETYHPYSSGTDDNLLTYKLNGQQIAQEALLGKPVSVKLPNEYLQAGENVLEVRLSKENDGKFHWLQFDYHRLVMKPNRGLFIVVQ